MWRLEIGRRGDVSLLGPLWLAATVALLSAACGAREPDTPPLLQVNLLGQAAAAGEILYERRVREHLEALREGEQTPYLVESFRLLGLEPGAQDGEWEERVAEVRYEVTAGTWVFRHGGRDLTLTHGSNFVAATGRDRTSLRLEEAGLVFVGPSVPEVREGSSLRGRLLVVMVEASGTGEQARAELVAASRRHLERARAARAAGVLFVVGPGAQGEAPERPILSSEEAVLAATGTGLRFAAWLSDGASRRLLFHVAGTGPLSLSTLAARRDFRPLPLNATASMDLETRLVRSQGRNLLAMRRGRDPAAAEELVLYLAPLAPAADEPGVDGVWAGSVRAEAISAGAQLLAIAAAYQMLSDPPRRSVLFAFVAPGRDGLVGLRHLLEGSLDPAERIAAAVLLGAGGAEGRIGEIASVAHDTTPLALTLERAARARGQRVVASTLPPASPFAGAAIRYLAQRGVPSALLADVPQGGLAGQAHVAFLAGLEVAEAAEAPARASAVDLVTGLERAAARAAAVGEGEHRVATAPPPRSGQIRAPPATPGESPEPVAPSPEQRLPPPAGEEARSEGEAPPRPAPPPLPSEPVPPPDRPPIPIPDPPPGPQQPEPEPEPLPEPPSPEPPSEPEPEPEAEEPPPASGPD